MFLNYQLRWGFPFNSPRNTGFRNWKCLHFYWSPDHWRCHQKLLIVNDWHTGSHQFKETELQLKKIAKKAWCSSKSNTSTNHITSPKTWYKVTQKLTLSWLVAYYLVGFSKQYMMWSKLLADLLKHSSYTYLVCCKW